MKDPLYLLFPSMPDRARLAFTGSGGKSSLIFSLARTLSDLGYGVFITTTTHMWNPEKVRPALPEFKLIITEQPESGFCKASPVFLASGLTPDGQKIRGYLPEQLSFPLPPKTFLLIEADGSAQRLLKAHAPHEPVCPPADLTIAVAGLGVLGKALSDATVHRARLACELLSVPEGTLVRPDHVAALLSSLTGPLKNASGSFYFFLNQLTPENLPAATLLASLLPHPALGGNAAQSEAIFLNLPQVSPTRD